MEKGKRTKKRMRSTKIGGVDGQELVVINSAPAWLEQTGAAVTSLAGGVGSSSNGDPSALDRMQAEHEKLRMLIDLQSNSDARVSELATKTIHALESGLL